MVTYNLLHLPICQPYINAGNNLIKEHATRKLHQELSFFLCYFPLPKVIDPCTCFMNSFVFRNFPAVQRIMPLTIFKYTLACLYNHCVSLLIHTFNIFLAFAFIGYYGLITFAKHLETQTYKAYTLQNMKKVCWPQDQKQQMMSPVDGEAN